MLALVTLIQAGHRAGQGRSALLKWSADVAAVLDPSRPADRVYGRDAVSHDEGFPMLPVAALMLAPFLWVGQVLGESAGAWLWALLKVVLAWWMLGASLRLAGARPRDWPPWPAALVVLLSMRVLLSDVSHGNVNIAIGACVVGAAVCFADGRDLRAGLLAGLGTALKVTPGLLLVYFLWKRSWRGAAGWLAGLVLFAFVLPAPLLGFERNAQLARAWWGQMIAPALEGAPLTLVQTQQINQSYLGVLARWTTDSIAIDSEPPVSIHVLSLEPAEFRRLLGLVSLATLVALLACVRRSGSGSESGPRSEPGSPGRERAPPVVLGEFALTALAMLFLSERSWKHHWVLLMLPLTFLAWTWVRGRGLERRIAAAGLAASAALHGLTGSGVLGDRGSDLAEAYGAFLLGGLVLFGSVGWLLRARPQ